MVAPRVVQAHGAAGGLELAVLETLEQVAGVDRPLSGDSRNGLVL
jgi:hypothetical protein